MTHKASVRVPVRREDVTAEWLTEFLRPLQPDVQVDAVETLTSTQGAATRLRIRVTYSPGREAGLPEILFVKTSLTRRMLVADPHMYVTEVRFYERIRSTLACETPAVYGFGLDEATNRFAVVMEDLACRGASFPTALSGLSAADIVPLMTTLAQLHAAHWGAPDLTRRFDWLETTAEGNTARWWIHESRSVVEDELGQAYKMEALGLDANPLDRVYAALAALQRVNDEGPLTVIHGDTHVGNCYLLPEAGGLLDWQLMRVANWGNDVGYLIMTALDVETRRSSERDLLSFYLEELRRFGVDPPSWDDAWLLYRRQMVWGILAWLVTPTAMYSEPLLGALIRRCAQAAEDHDTCSLLGVSE